MADIKPDSALINSADDRLGRALFAQNIAKAILNYKDDRHSLTIGIYGPWGSGKSSVVNMIVNLFEGLGESGPIIIRFRPWYFSGQDQLFEQFFSALEHCFSNTFGKKAKKLCKLVADYADVLKPITNNSSLLNSIISLSQKFTQKKDLITLKNDIANELKKLNKKIIIDIDDIDRLTKQEILQIFQLVKGCADLPNITYILSFDKAVIEQALKDVQSGDPSTYLEKIIQVPLELPKIQPTHLKNHLFENLREITDLGEQKYYEPELNRLDVHLYFNNLREINYFINLFKFDYALLKNKVNILDLIIITSIKSHDRNLYRYISKNKDLFTKGKTALTQLIANIENRKNPVIIDKILTEIFTAIENVSSPDNLSPDEGVSLLTICDRRKETSQGQINRISIPQCFDRLFYMAIPDDEVPQELD